MVTLPFNMVVASLSPTWEFYWLGRISVLCCVALSARIVFLHRPKVFWGIMFAIAWTQVFASIAYECGKSSAEPVKLEIYGGPAGCRLERPLK